MSTSRETLQSFFAKHRKLLEFHERQNKNKIEQIHLALNNLQACLDSFMSNNEDALIDKAIILGIETLEDSESNEYMLKLISYENWLRSLLELYESLLTKNKPWNALYLQEIDHLQKMAELAIHIIKEPTQSFNHLEKFNDLASSMNLHKENLHKYLKIRIQRSEMLMFLCIGILISVMVLSFGLLGLLAMPVSIVVAASIVIAAVAISAIILHQANKLANLSISESIYNKSSNLYGSVVTLFHKSKSERNNIIISTPSVIKIESQSSSNYSKPLKPFSLDPTGAPPGGYHSVAYHV